MPVEVWGVLDTRGRDREMRIAGATTEVDTGAKFKGSCPQKPDLKGVR